MGITISFTGSVKEPAARTRVLSFAEEFARDHEWGLKALELRPERAVIGQRSLKSPSARGVVLCPHFASEPIPMVFLEPMGELVDSFAKSEIDGSVRFSAGPIVKTQFAGVRAHREICTFLKLLQTQDVPSLKVDDETDFFDRQDEDRLQARFAESWSALASQFKELRSRPEEKFMVGGFNFRAGTSEPVSEFFRITEEHQAMLLQAEAWLMTRFSGFGTNLDRTKESIQDLDLLMSDADDQDFAERPDDPSVELFVHGVGVYFGRTLVAHYGGSWEFDEDEGLVLGNVAGIGLEVDPFQIAADRLVHGPPFGFDLHTELVDDFARSFGS